MSERGSMSEETKLPRTWPQKRNGHLCRVCGVFMVNREMDSVCLKCGRTHEGLLGKNKKGELTLLCP
jgi:rubrerythrin